MDESSTMANKVKEVAGVLDNCAALLEEYSEPFPRPDSGRSTAVAFADQILRLARDHGLRTIRGMNRLLTDDEGNVALACTLLRPFYELSVRLLWASRQDDGWRRLELYFANRIKAWAKGCKDLPNPAMAKLGSDLLQRPIEGEYAYVYLDGIWLKRSWGGEVRNIAILVACAATDTGKSWALPKE
jgi:hypothetical protein